MILDLLRLFFTAALLVVVWRNAHWSVALCLTFDAITLETLAYLSRRKADQMAAMRTLWSELAGKKK